MQNRPLQAAIGSTLLILIGIVHPIFVGEMYVETDLGNFHVPVRHFYASQIAAGESFLWFPYMFNGFHLHGEGQASLFHPMQWLLYRFVPVSPAFMLEVLRNHVVLLVGAYLLLRRFALPRAACAFAAMAAGFCSFQMLHFMHLNVVAITSHLPWMLLCIDVALRSAVARNRAVACVALALGTASQLLHGHPQFALFVLVGEAAFAAGSLALHGGWARVPWLGFAHIVGVALAGVQWLPQWEALASSVRAAPAAHFANTLALDPRELVQLLSPYFYRDRVYGDTQPVEFALYASAAFPVLLAWLWIRRDGLGPHRRATTFLVLACVVFLWMALGEAGLLFRIQAALPGLDHFRAPARYVLLFQGAVVGLLAIAFADLRAHVASGAAISWSRLRPLSIPLLIVLVLTLASPWLEGSVSSAPSGGLAGRLGTPVARAIGPLLVVAATLLVGAAARGQRFAPVALVLLLAADLGGYGLSFMARMPPLTMDAFVTRSPAPAWADRHRIHFGPPGWTVREIRLSSGYAAMIPTRRLPTDVYQANAVPAESLIPALRVTGIGRAFGRPVPGPLPRARLLARTERIEADLIAQLARTDVARVGLVPADLRLEPGPAGAAQIRVDRPGRVEIETQSAAERLLVLAESHHPGWRATIDGEPADVVTVYGDFIGCVVPAGTHHVILRFAPPSVTNGLRISAIGALLLPLLYCGVALAERPSRRRTV